MTTLHAKVWTEPARTVISPSGRPVPVEHLSHRRAVAALRRRARHSVLLYFYWGLTPDMLPKPLLLRPRMVWDSTMHGDKFTTPCLYDRYHP